MRILQLLKGIGVAQFATLRVCQPHAIRTDGFEHTRRGEEEGDGSADSLAGSLTRLLGQDCAHAIRQHVTNAGSSIV